MLFWFHINQKLSSNQIDKKWFLLEQNDYISTFESVTLMKRWSNWKDNLQYLSNQSSILTEKYCYQIAKKRGDLEFGDRMEGGFIISKKKVAFLAVDTWSSKDIYNSFFFWLINIPLKRAQKFWKINKRKRFFFEDFQNCLIRFCSKNIWNQM